MTVLTIHHRKGGVGKTTTVQHVATAASKAGIKTLAIDMDGQANLTMALGISEPKKGIADLLQAEIKRESVPIENYILQVADNLDLIPSTNQLFKIQDEIANFQGMRAHLLEKIKHRLEKYTLVVIDTPPQAGWLVSNALIVADRIVAPISCETFAVDGLAGLSESLKELGELNNSDGRPLKLSALVPTMFHGSRNAHKELLQAIRNEFGDLVTKSFIRVDANIETAQANNKTVFDFSPNTRSAEDYINLTEEILS